MDNVDDIQRNFFTNVVETLVVVSCGLYTFVCVVKMFMNELVT